MSGYYYPTHQSPHEEDEFDFGQPLQTHTHASQPFDTYDPFLGQPTATDADQSHFYTDSQQIYQHTPPFQHPFDPSLNQHPAWIAPTIPSNYYPQQTDAPYPHYPEPGNYGQDMTTAGPSRRPTSYLSPELAERTRASRSTSFASNASSAYSASHSDVSRSVSPNASEMSKWVRLTCDIPLALPLTVKLRRVVRTTMAAGAVHILPVHPGPLSTEDVTCGNTTSGTQNRSSVDTKAVLKHLKAGFRARKTAHGMRRSTIRRSRATGRDATACLVESTIW